MVIAAFTDKNREADLAEALTQEQADAVRRYLVEKYAIDSIGWFSGRKVAAVGFGSRTPVSDLKDANPPTLPARRVEVIVFTPQG